ncbi:MAG: flagellin [Pseudomonadales bacterium]
MALGINTNVLSLNAQRNLNNSQSALATSLERLSTGLRINSAKDDAAGLAIAERFTTQIRGLNQAVRNASDGISLAQTAESALGELTNNLQRIRELAIQSANVTNSASDRAALDNEVQQRLDEIDRIARQTSFNGQKVLDGSLGTATFQVGANVGETISISLNTSVRTNQIGQIATATSSTEVTTAALSGTGTIAVGSNAAVTIGASVAGTAAGQNAGSAYAKAEAINNSGVAGLTVTARNNVAFAIADTTDTGAASEYNLRINGQDIFAAFDQETGGTLTTSQIADAINAQSSNTGVTAALAGSVLYLSAADGRDIIIGQEVTDAGGGITAGAASTFNGVDFRAGSVGATVAAAVATSTDADAVNGGTLSLSATENIILTGDADDMGLAATTDYTIALDTNTLATINVNSVTEANNTISRVDSALEVISTLRSELGAIQNRFESTISGLQAVSENLAASRGRIQDADFAAETAALTKAQILQQAGVAVLAQANAQPQVVLSLLQ